MATFEELVDVMNDTSMQKRVQGAICIFAFDLLNADEPTKQERWWARAVLHNPEAEAIKTWRFIVSKNDSKDIAFILGMPDRGGKSIQNHLEKVIPQLIMAMSTQ